MDLPVDEAAILKLLRAGDEAIFTWLVEQYHASLVRLATLFVQDGALGEELAQETWLAVVQGVKRFEGRSSLKTWIFTILTNKAKTRSQREKRVVAFSDMEGPLRAAHQPTVDPKRFNDASAEKWSDHWATESKPTSWASIPEDQLISQETMGLINQVIKDLPETQRAVITLRDIHELSSAEVCNALGVSETNQRVLLHRARARVRQALEDYLQPES